MFPKYFIHMSPFNLYLYVSCRNSVHTQGILCRLLNSSPVLDWKTCVALGLSRGEGGLPGAAILNDHVIYLSLIWTTC